MGANRETIRQQNAERARSLVNAGNMSNARKQKLAIQAFHDETERKKREEQRISSSPEPSSPSFQYRF